MDANRGYYGELTDYPGWVAQLMDNLNGDAWVTGVESNKRGRGEAINVDVYSYDEAQRLAVVQVRQCRFGRRYPQVRKQYFLIGRNENGNPFAHPVATVARYTNTVEAGVIKALCKIWGCDADELAHIVRNGDVALVPAGRLPGEAEEITAKELIIRGTHIVKKHDGSAIYRRAHVSRGRYVNTYYIKGSASIYHTKGQHPTSTARGGTWRVVAGWQDASWDFAAPTAD